MAQLLPQNLATGSYKVCARIDSTFEVTETYEFDQTVISDRALWIRDRTVEPALCN